MRRKFTHNKKGKILMSTLPEQFEHATIIAKANVYFDGKVVRHTVNTADGAKKTVGVIFPGSYHFGTGAPERMEITSGGCKVKLDGAEDWNDYGAGETFEVPGNSGFDIAVETEHADYICTFLA